MLFKITSCSSISDKKIEIQMLNERGDVYAE